MGKPKQAWAFWANMSGPWNQAPRRVMRADDGKWWDRQGDADIEKMGLDEKGASGYLSFASSDKREVTRFIQGFMAARRLMSNFTTDTDAGKD